MNKAKHYTKEFKNETVKLVTEQGFSQNEIGRRLGVSSKNISRWVADSRKSTAPLSLAATQEQELIKRLQKENLQLRMEREILKKAAAFFASELS